MAHFVRWGKKPTSSFLPQERSDCFLPQERSDRFLPQERSDRFLPQERSDVGGGGPLGPEGVLGEVAR